MAHLIDDEITATIICGLSANTPDMPAFVL